jgi:hypothetical protein
MGLAPDVIFRIAPPVFTLPQSMMNDIANNLRDRFFDDAMLDYLRKKGIVALDAQAPVYSNGVLTIGLWIGADQREDGRWVEDGFTIPQRTNALMASSFGALNQVGLFISAAMLQLQGRAELTKKHEDGVDPDSLRAVFGKGGNRIVTEIEGKHHEPFPFPDIPYTYMATESLDLGFVAPDPPPGATMELQSRLITHDVEASILGITIDSALADLIISAIGLSFLNIDLGNLAFIGGEVGGTTADETHAGLASKVAEGWPLGYPVKPPIVVGTFQISFVGFDWQKLTVDSTGVGTTGGLFFVPPKDPKEQCPKLLDGIEALNELLSTTTDRLQKRQFAQQLAALKRQARSLGCKGV